MRKCHFMLLVILLLILPLARVGADDKPDLLLVNIMGNQGEQLALNLYDPTTNMSTPLLTNFTENDFAFTGAMLSADGRLAYSTSFEGRLELVVSDSNQPDQEIVEVKPVGEGDQYALAWSPDGHKLAFQVQMPDGHPLIYVWDGKTSVEVTPQNMAGDLDPYLNTTWSPDGHKLAFVSYIGNQYGYIYVWDGNTVTNISPQGDPGSYLYYENLSWSAGGRLVFTLTDNADTRGEIYVWDGHTTMNLSQNPTGNDEQPVWSADGRVAFLSARDSVQSILVWDGTSLKDGQPDVSSFAAVPPDLNVNYSWPTWTSAGNLAFAASAAGDSNPQIYTWDGQTETNISQNPTKSNAFPVWSRDGLWAFNGLDQVQQFLYVRDADNQTLLMTPASAAAYYKPAWSLNDELTFCRRDAQEWVLAVWNGQDVLEVARGPHIWAQWQSGEGVNCFSG